MSGLSANNLQKKGATIPSVPKGFHALGAVPTLEAVPGLSLEEQINNALRLNPSAHVVGIQHKGKEYLVQITPITPIPKNKSVGGTRKRRTKKSLPLEK